MTDQERPPEPGGEPEGEPTPEPEQPTVGWTSADPARRSRDPARSGPAGAAHRWRATSSADRPAAARGRERLVRPDPARLARAAGTRRR